MQVDANGAGVVNILVADKLVQEPAVYSTLLLWLLSELFENLPEIGDPEKPKLVLFFDEAHLMFKDTPKTLVEKIEQVVRLIRSKGVGVYFITQSPGDIPDSVLGQLANRVQHALRAYTPKEQKVVRVAAQTFRSDKSFSVQEAITVMGVGEALISTLLANGAPSMVKRTMVKPPVSRIGAASKGEVHEILWKARSWKNTKPRSIVNPHSKKLAKRAQAAANAAAEKKPTPKRAHVAPKPRGRQRQSIAETFAKSVVRSLGGKAGRALVRGILGSLFKGS